MIAPRSGGSLETLNIAFRGFLLHNGSQEILSAALRQKETNVAGKTLVPTMLKEATDLSRHITEFQAFKAGLFTDNPELVAKAAECGACLIEFIQELSAAREYGD